MKQERLPQDIKDSKILALYKQEGDVIHCENYSWIKLLEIGLNVYEKVIQRRIRERVNWQETTWTEMRMLRWLLGASVKDNKGMRSSEIRWCGMHYW